MIALLLALTLASPTPCKHRVVVYRNKVPTCTYSPIGRVTAQGLNRDQLYTDIQVKVCALGGHAILTKSETSGTLGMSLNGIVVRCNVPFLLPSDLRARE